MGDDTVPSAVTGLQGSGEAIRCAWCNRFYKPRQSNQAFCCPKCSDRAYNSAHPVRRTEPQRRLEFTPTASVEENHRQSQRRAVLAALRLGPQTALTLFPIAGPGFSSRLAELRKEGHQIVTRMDGRHGVYTLASEAGAVQG